MAEEKRSRRAAAKLRELDSNEITLAAARRVRSLLPGDDRYGDALSLGKDDPAGVIGKQLATRGKQQPSALRELGFSALQVWQSLSEAQGRGQGEEELAILFTDLVGFSDWALEAGDTLAVDLLRAVGEAVEPCVAANAGRVVKRLGDGLMAVFDDASCAVTAAYEAAGKVADLEVGGHRPRLRAGVHVGTPRRLGGDYLGVAVNVAARVGAAAGPGEVLISEDVRERLDRGSVDTKRKWRFSGAKGAPSDLKLYSVRAVQGE
ncbi:MAG: adenylate/guanylate cyclase domain-containing protein [Thermoleophilaceae bacterium]|nr:adenylate/guanylate cyclase domain-containing protein [Thermoleophilaceae bacterium]